MFREHNKLLQAISKLFQKNSLDLEEILFRLSIASANSESSPQVILDELDVLISKFPYLEKIRFNLYSILEKAPKKIQIPKKNKPYSVSERKIPKHKRPSFIKVPPKVIPLVEPKDVFLFETISAEEIEAQKRARIFHKNNVKAKAILVDIKRSCDGGKINFEEIEQTYKQHRNFFEDYKQQHLDAMYAKYEAS